MADAATGQEPWQWPEAVWRRKINAARAAGGLCLLTMHPHAVGHRSRIHIVEKIIHRANSLDTVRLATHADIAAYGAAEAGWR
jgi:hypothetical protein